jgi:phytoene dehydrogenase-like protein
VGLTARAVPATAAGAARRHDVIVVGAGHNGLVAACYLARAGLDVLVLERNAYVGGAAVSRKLYQDFTYSNCSYVCSLLRPEIMRTLELPRFGLQIIPYEGGCTMMRDGGHLAVYDNHDAMRREIARHSRRDAEAYDRFARDVMRQCKFIKPLLMRTPPDPTSFKPRDIRELLYLGQRFHGLGESRMYDTLRFWTMSAADFLDEYFESEIVKAHFAGSSIIGTALGPRSPGTAYVLLHHYMGDIDDTVGAWGFARGGMGAVSGALAASLTASGGTIVAAAPVTNIRDAWRTSAVFSISGPTMMPGVSHKNRIGMSNASHSCMKRAALSAPLLSIAPARCTGLLAISPTGRPSILINAVTMPGPKCRRTSSTEPLSAIVSITARTS